MNDQLNFLQINQNHSRVATDMLNIDFIKKKIHVALIQEPYAYKGKLTRLKGGSLVYDSSNSGVPRACILFHKDVKYFPLTQFCSKDVVSATVVLDDSSKIVVCSAYMAGDNSDIPLMVKQLSEFCKNSSLQLLIGCDSNAHHTIWGNVDTNDRGEAILDFLSTNDLEIVNKGNDPTFVRSNCSTVIDLTLASRFLSTKIKNWEVSKDWSGSDHKYIAFSVGKINNFILTYRVPQRTNWEEYRERLEVRVNKLKLKISTVAQLDNLAKDMNDAILEAYNLSCPMMKKNTNRENLWWNEFLRKSRQKVRKLENRAHNKQLREPGREEDRENALKEYKEAKTKYNNDIRQAKRETFRCFLEKMNDIGSSARMHKLLSKNHANSLGALRQDDGSYTVNSKQTLELMAKIHFPESSILNENAGTTSIQNQQGTDLNYSKKVFTEERIKWAIETFKPFKSAGKDEIFPALLQEGLKILLPVLEVIFVFSHATGHIPSLWRESKVVYIPKVGKKPSDSPKSFRPITLSSFLLKTMERILDRLIRDTFLQEQPLNRNQHAYQEGKSTISALKSVVQEIEKVFTQKEICIGISMDIEGAFDNTKYETIIKGLEAKNVDRQSIKWIESMLRNRILYSSLLNETVIIKPNRGCPQGGVLSPLLWALVADKPLKLLNDAGFFTTGFADDFFTLVKGKFAETVSDMSQLAVNIIEKWCKTEELSVNPDKVALVIFTKKTKPGNFKKPMLFGKPINYSTKVKFLGLILDQKLTWNPQLDNVIQKATCSLFTCKRMIGNTWGISSRMMHWMYCAIVRPMITYGAQVWYKKVDQKTAQRELSKLQRLALLMMTGGFKTTPTAALEILTNVPPLHLFLKYEALIGNYRFSVSGKVELEKLTDTFLENMGSSKNMSKIKRSDFKINSYNFQQQYLTIFPSKEEWLNNQINLKDYEVIWYTDGSKTENCSGAGLHCIDTEIYVSLGKYASVFQAETHAIELAARKCLDNKFIGKKIAIVSDSQAALKAIEGVKVNSKLVWDCKNLLTALSLNNEVHLLWIPGHSGLEGNEKADELARIGSSSQFIGPEPYFGMCLSNIKMEFKLWLELKMNIEWEIKTSMVHSKEIMPRLNKNRSKEFLYLSKNDASLVTRFVTGHGAFNKHLHTLHMTTEDKCRLCKDEKETSRHLLCECEALAAKRYNLFGKSELELTELSNVSFKDLLKLIKHKDIINKV